LHLTKNYGYLFSKKWLIRLIILLSIINLAQIIYFTRKANHSDKQSQPLMKNNQELSKILKKELNLSVDQTNAFSNIRADFFEKEKLLSTIMHDKETP
jgi:multisubunit Na+/H+ antiporter MnhC subunit